MLVQFDFGFCGIGGGEGRLRLGVVCIRREGRDIEHRLQHYRTIALDFRRVMDEQSEKIAALETVNGQMRLALDDFRMTHVPEELFV